MLPSRFASRTGDSLLSIGDSIRSGHRNLIGEKTMRVVIMLLAGLLALSACNTFEGVGRDVQDAGEAIEDEAQE
jgi:predicted small secreted protein